MLAAAVALAAARDVRAVVPAAIAPLRPAARVSGQSVSLDGHWESTDTTKRFRLEIAKDTCVWIERSATSAELRRTVTVEKAAGGMRISRPNDAEVLTFLGFQPTLRGEILQKQPKPSFMILTRQNDTLTGLWSGIVAIKDNKGHLQELKQPGQTPAKAFEFKKG
jgi:hypothetical protein